MSDLAAFSIPWLPAAFHFLPAFVWSVIAWDLCRYAYQRRPQSQFFRVAPVVALLMATHFDLHFLIEITRSDLGGRTQGLNTVFELIIEVLNIGSAAAFRHMVWLLPVREEPPPRRWLILHYGLAAALMATRCVLLFSGASQPWSLTIVGLYMIGVGGVSIRHMWRHARAGAWNPGGLQLRTADVRLGMIALLAGGVLVMLWIAGGLPGERTAVVLFFHTAFGLGFAFPFAVRMLGRLVRVAAVFGTTVVWAAGLYLGLPLLIAAIEDDELRRLATVGAVALLTLLIANGYSWMLRIGDWKSRTFGAYLPELGFHRFYRLLFNRGARADMHAFLVNLSPQLGVAECCQRTVARLVEVMQLRGAGILLRPEDIAVTAGTINLGPLQEVWIRLPAGELPERAFAGAELRELPVAVKEAVIATDVVGIIPIAGPRRRWGHLFIATGFMETATSDESVEILQASADQLALVLDTAELLARAIEVERSLAHAERLAAIGELAARIAHEIRNPVTAARSLAQQLTREPALPFQSEHAVILAELERVERQVAALLRFARREEFRFMQTDLRDLVRNTAAELRPRLEAAGITLTVDAPEPLVARADPEKLRQVLVNLIENARDALTDAPGPRRLGVRLVRENGAAQLRVSDSGPGAPAEVLGRLFEPFFSLKPHGTGLGLAIAKRAIDAHGGSISVSRLLEGGLAFDIELPLAERAQ
jgi:signal transduction histidine kinase